MTTNNEEQWAIWLSMLNWLEQFHIWPLKIPISEVHWPVTFTAALNKKITSQFIY